METQSKPTSSSSGESLHFLSFLKGFGLAEEYYESQGIRSTESYYTTSQGRSLFTRSWRPPPDTPTRALVFMVHGYGSDISWNFQSTPIFLARNGYSCFALDLPGHGRSDGLKAFVPDLHSVVRDCISYFSSIRDQHEFSDSKAFLFGESMGGAICLLIHLGTTADWDGAVLVAPMCRISGNVRPSWPVPQLLTFFAGLFPTMPIVPTADFVDKTYRVEEKRTVATSNPMRYKGKARLGTVLELLRITGDLAARLSEVALPFLVLHGSDDAVTDPDVSRRLHCEARSEDKTIKIYRGMMHSLLFGETDDNVAVVMADILACLNHRCSHKLTLQHTGN